tara:strand:- start:194 stop:436 length:243 start_codon:yes stop_codon:yes gene_type:complete
MSNFKKKAEAPKKVEAKKPEALKPKPKVETLKPKPKVETLKPKTLGELKKEFAAARKAHPEQDDAIRTEYLKHKAILQGK